VTDAASRILETDQRRTTVSPSEFWLHTEASITDFRLSSCRCSVFTMAPSVAHLLDVKVVRLLQAAVPISATFTTPFCARTRLGRG
jgi:hypothetical protein